MSGIKMWVEFCAVSVIAFAFRWLPVRIVHLKSKTLGWLIAKLIKLRIDEALNNLSRAFPEMKPDKHRQIYLRCWQHFVRVGAELSRLPRLTKTNYHKFVRIPTEKLLDEHLKHDKGIIAVSGHFGNWELMGGVLSIAGYPITYVVTNQSNKLVESWIDRMRESAGIEIVRREDAIKGILSALKRNRIVAILCDQDAGEAGIFTDYFGMPASTPRGPALFHLKTGVPIIYATCIYAAQQRKYEIRLRKMEFGEPTGDRELDTHEIMSLITQNLEHDVRNHPEQWLWLHRRWKTKP